jgi:hypothetical protein
MCAWDALLKQRFSRFHHDSAAQIEHLNAILSQQGMKNAVTMTAAALVKQMRELKRVLACNICHIVESEESDTGEGDENYSKLLQN